MNRAILAGSVIVGIAVMMSISIIAPAFAASYWKDVFICDYSDPETTLGGTEYWVSHNGDSENTTADGCGDKEIVRAFCTSKSGADGHWEFKDFRSYDGEQTENEQTRCHKSNFWIETDFIKNNF